MKILNTLDSWAINKVVDWELKHIFAHKNYVGFISFPVMAGLYLLINKKRLIDLINKEKEVRANK